jgi:hypothetical protein
LQCRLSRTVEGRVRLKDRDVVEEADETIFWLELLVETGIVSKPKMTRLLDEANQLIHIFSASQSTARKGAGDAIA